MAGPRRLPYLPGMSAGLPIPVRSRHLEGAEVAWFAPICNGDFEFLGVPDGRYRSSWANASAIVREADRLGYRNVLCPSSYQPGQDTLPFVAALSQVTDRINLLAAVRCGEVWPPMLARTLATIDHMLRGRLTVNIISSDLPGEQRPSAERYARSREVIRILRQAWTAERIEHDGRFYRLDLPTDPVRPYQQDGGPLLYFGGYSPEGQDLCAEFCDVYLLWPETEDRLEAQMREMADRAAAYGRTIDYGLRVHVIVRETEAEARAAASAPRTPAPSAWPGRPGCGSAPTPRASPSRTSGRASAAAVRAAGPPWWAIPTRCWPRSAATWTWASAPSSSAAIPTWTSAGSSRATSCRTSPP
jgi:alkanesulfonate monooxygenase SsuD/methylene tetrahydromethanopterin reductase-like flavin-dependent oxidoreductase (luciferase family)